MSESSGGQFEIDGNGRIPFEGELQTHFRSFKNAVSSNDRSSPELLADMTAAMTARETGGEQYSAGDTFFMPASGVPRCGLESLALSIFREHAKGAKFDPSRSGAEWWTQAIDVRDDIGVHFDRDYGMEEYGLNVHPHVATVTYLSDLGGPTVVLEHTSSVEVGQDFSGSVDRVFMSYPEAGKHMSFDGRYLHLAPGDLMGGRKKRGTRYTFLVNVWLNHIPINSDLLPEEFLGSMKWRGGKGIGNFSNEMECEKVQFLGSRGGKPLELKFILDDHKGALRFPSGAKEMIKCVEDGAEGSMVEFGFGGKNGGEVVVERLGEVVEGEKESSEEEDDEDGSSEDDSGEESEVEESPTKKRKL